MPRKRSRSCVAALSKPWSKLHRGLYPRLPFWQSWSYSTCMINSSADLRRDSFALYMAWTVFADTCTTISLVAVVRCCCCRQPPRCRSLSAYCSSAFSSLSQHSFLRKLRRKRHRRLLRLRAPEYRLETELPRHHRRLRLLGLHLPMYFSVSRNSTLAASNWM